MSQFEFPLAVRELTPTEFIAKRLREHRCAVAAGVLDGGQIRAAVIASGVECAVIGRGPAGKPETYAEYFERHIGEPLIPKKRKEKTPC